MGNMLRQPVAALKAALCLFCNTSNFDFERLGAYFLVGF